jgi:hypothetical protein
MQHESAGVIGESSRHEVGWPFSERNSVSVQDNLEVILNPPEVLLGPEEQAAAREFAGQLFNGVLPHLDLRVETEGADAAPTLGAVDKLPVAATKSEFYLGYLETTEGREALRTLGVEGDDPEAVVDGWYAQIAHGEKINAKARQTISSNSVVWYGKQLTEALRHDHDGEFPDPRVTTVNFAPDAMLQKAAQAKAYRRFYREVRGVLKNEPDSAAHDARIALLDLHMAKANHVMSIVYPSLALLSEQLAVSPETPLTEGWKRRLMQVMPASRYVLAGQASDGFIDEFARRLDLMRNGAANRGDTTYSPINEEVSIIAQSLESQVPTIPDIEPMFSEEEVKHLSEVRWDASQQKRFFEAVLTSWDLLSDEQIAWDEVKGRKGSASDGKWQVVIVPPGKPVEVSNSKWIVQVPADFDRSLTQTAPAGSLAVTPHELAHVLQAEYNRQLAAQLALIGVNGRRSLTSHEMGAIYYERYAQALLGQARPAQATYVRALEAKLSGGSHAEMARRFAEAHIGGTDDESQLEQGRKAAKNVLRLCRHAGHNSQPLDYIEQHILAQEVERLPEARAEVIALAATGLSLADTAVMRRFGLLELPDHVKQHPARDAMRVFRGQFYPAFVAAS